MAIKVIVQTFNQLTRVFDIFGFYMQNVFGDFRKFPQVMELGAFS